MNGIIDNGSYHDAYLEGINVTYEYNDFGALRTGSNGTLIKDRSANTIVRYNDFSGPGYMLMLENTENYQYTVLAAVASRFSGVCLQERIQQ